ncbi:photosynthetic protein synthase I [Pseudoalteromonas luteoviolacea]|uniref:Photosynthetic protein synthase I n=1 Tax=Pseudoalteromonas luteoviolacea TaxID=43657 RepID=A0A1C0TLD1_9GAMM|nr:SCO family protein [Pseudoalteromonas luteoviolacea]OCQ19626.1 photosynthetic protein synthase I [Pseudoalteromonas luteoviolacea]
MRLILLFILVGILAACRSEEAVSELTVHYPEPKILKPFELLDQHDRIVSNKDLLGRWNLLFLGYTSCPDICPMTLSKLTHINTKISELADSQVWFVSVDPHRDTSEKRLDYVSYFDKAFIAATQQHKQLFPFVRDIGLIYAINDRGGADYYVDHSASIALINPLGKLEAIFKPEFKQGQVPNINAEKMVQDFKIILEQSK